MPTIAPLQYSPMAHTGVENNTTEFAFPTRATGDIEVTSITNPATDHSVDFGIQNVTARITSLDTSGSNQVWANVTVERLATHTFEYVLGNATYTMGLGETRFVYFEWHPTADANEYLINVSVICITNSDPDPSNNFLTAKVLLNSGLNARADIISHIGGGKYAKATQTVKADIQNFGTFKITQNFYVNLTITNVSSSAIVFAEDKALNISQAGTDIQVSGNKTTISFGDWVPPALGQYKIAVETRLSGDNYLPDNMSQVTVTIANIQMSGVEVVALEPTIQVIPPGQKTLNPPYESYRFKIQNRGSTADQFNWTATSGHGWILGNNPTKGKTATLNPNDWSSEIVIDIGVPLGASQSDVDDLVLYAESVNDPTVYKSNLTRTYTQEIHDMLITSPTSKWGTPGGDYIDYVFSVTNKGNIGEAFDVFIGGNQSGWKAIMHTTRTKFLDPGDTAYLLAEIKIPDLDYDTRISDHTFYGAQGFLTLSAKSAYTQSTKSATVYTYVNLIYTADIEITPATLAVDPLMNKTQTQSLKFGLHVRNVCNREEVVTEGESDINLSVSSDTPRFHLGWGGVNETESSRWNASVSKQTTHLRMGEWDNSSILNVVVPGRPFNGWCEVNVTAQSTGDEDGFGIEVNSSDTAKVSVNQTAGVEVFPPTDADQTNLTDVDKNGRYDWKEAAPLETLSLRFNISNIGNGLDQFLLSTWAEPLDNRSSGDEWLTSVRGTNKTDYLQPKEFDILSPLHFAFAYVNVTIPGGLDIDLGCKIYLKARSGYNINVSAQAFVTIFVKQGAAVDLEPETNSTSVLPNETAVFNINVTNAGNGDDTIKLEYTPTPPLAWTVVLSVSQISLKRGQTQMVNLTVTPTFKADAAVSLVLFITGTSTKDPTKFDSVEVTTIVKQLAGVNVTAIAPNVRSEVPGKSIKFQFTIQNTGNAEDSFQVRAVNQYNWSMKYELAGESGQKQNLVPIRLLKDALTRFNVTLTIPALPPDPTLQDLIENGTLAYTENLLTVNATSIFDNAVRNETWAKVIVAKLGAARISSNKNSISIMPGGRAVYNLTLKNTGNYEDVYNITFETDLRYISWVSIPTSALKLNVTLSTYLTMYVDAKIQTQPYLHEEAVVRAYVASDNSAKRVSSVTTLTKIVMMDIADDILTVDFGKKVNFDIKIMNVPTIPVYSQADDYDQIYFIYCVDLKTGLPPVTPWSRYVQSIVNMSTAYEQRSIAVTVNAPTDIANGDEDSLSLSISVEPESEPGSAKVTPDTKAVTVSLTYFDVIVQSVNVYYKGNGEPEKVTKGDDDVPIIDLDEGKEVVVQIMLKCQGNRYQGPFAIEMCIGDKRFNFSIPGLDPSLSQDSMAINQTVRLETLPWATKQDELQLTVLADPGDSVWESQRTGRSGANDNNAATYTIKLNDAGINPIFAAILVAILTILCMFLFYVIYMKDMKPYLAIVISLAIGCVVALLFSFPWQLLTSETDTVNYIGYGVIIFGLVMFGLVIWLSLEGTNPYLRFRLKQLEDRNEQAMQRGKRIVGLEALKDDVQGNEGKPISDEMYSSKAIPYAITTATAVVGLFAMISITATLLAYATSDPKNLLEPLLGKFLYLPVIAWILLYLIAGAVAIFVALKRRTKAYDEINEANAVIEGLKRDAERKMAEDEDVAYPEDRPEAYNDNAYPVEPLSEGGSPRYVSETLDDQDEDYPQEEPPYDQDDGPDDGYSQDMPDEDQDGRYDEGYQDRGYGEPRYRSDESREDNHAPRSRGGRGSPEDTDRYPSHQRGYEEAYPEDRERYEGPRQGRRREPRDQQDEDGRRVGRRRGRRAR